jgi:Tol biopolymer transport system component
MKMPMVRLELIVKRECSKVGGAPWRWLEPWLPVVLSSVLAAQAAGASFQLGSVVDTTLPPAAGGGGDSYAPVMSPDGRFVLFASTANNLVLNSNQGPLPLELPARLNVFLRDRTNQTTVLVSGNVAGSGGGNGDSLPSGLSTNGRYALFESSASNLVAGDTNNVSDIFMRDLVAGTTVLVSQNTNGVAANGASRGSVLTPDGHYVAFTSEASDLVTEDSNGIADVFVRDLQAGTTTLISVGAQASDTFGGSALPSITPDGCYVAFCSAATNLVAGGTNSGDIYVRDLVARTTTWVSSYARTARTLVSGYASALSCDPVLSADGQYVAYQANPVFGVGAFSGGVVLRYHLSSDVTEVIYTNATVRTGSAEDVRNLAMTPDGRWVAFIATTNGSAASDSGVYVWDAQSGTVVLASGDSNGNLPTNSACLAPGLDASGRWVVFLSDATNLVANPIAGEFHVYRRDLQSGTTTLVSADANGFGPGLNAATSLQITPDGRYAAFEGFNTDLVPNERNHAYNVFVRDLAAGTNELISVHHAALPSLSANGSSVLSAGSVSADGALVAFSSDADNLVPGDTNGYRDVFVHDLLAGTNCLVSVGTNGVAADGPSVDATLSSDGRYVVFTSSADNLVTGDTNKATDVFVRDLQMGTTTLLSVNASGTAPGKGVSYSPVISMDGRFVLFRSQATDLASGSFSGPENLFLRDRQQGVTWALTHSGVMTAAMTPDGRYVAFSSSNGGSFYLNVWDSLAHTVVFNPGIAGNLKALSPDASYLAFVANSTLSVIERATKVSWSIGPAASLSHPGMRFSGDGRWLAYVGPASGTNQVYLHDLQYRTNFLVSHSYNSAAGAYGVSDWPELSSDGRFVAYRSTAPNLVPGGGGASGVPQLFLYDRSNNSTMLLSVNRFGATPGNNRSLAPVFSADAQTLLFASWASDLVGQDFNQSGDWYAYRLLASGQIPVFMATMTCGMGAGQGPWLSWPAVPGRTYRVEFKNNLSDPGWQQLNQDVTIIGNQGSLNDLTAGPGPRFYRIVGY